MASCFGPSRRSRIEGSNLGPDSPGAEARPAHTGRVLPRFATDTPPTPPPLSRPRVQTSAKPKKRRSRVGILPGVTFAAGALGTTQLPVGQRQGFRSHVDNAGVATVANWGGELRRTPSGRDRSVVDYWGDLDEGLKMVKSKQQINALEHFDRSFNIQLRARFDLEGIEAGATPGLDTNGVRLFTTEKVVSPKSLTRLVREMDQDQDGMIDVKKDWAAFCRKHGLEAQKWLGGDRLIGKAVPVIGRATDGLPLLPKLCGGRLRTQLTAGLFVNAGLPAAVGEVLVNGDGARKLKSYYRDPDRPYTLGRAVDDGTVRAVLAGKVDLFRLPPHPVRHAAAAVEARLDSHRGVSHPRVIGEVRFDAADVVPDGFRRRAIDACGRLTRRLPMPPASVRAAGDCLIGLVRRSPAGRLPVGALRDGVAERLADLPPEWGGIRVKAKGSCALPGSAFLLPTPVPTYGLPSCLGTPFGGPLLRAEVSTAVFVCRRRIVPHVSIDVAAPGLGGRRAAAARAAAARAPRRLDTIDGKAMNAAAAKLGIVFGPTGLGPPRGPPVGPLGSPPSPLTTTTAPAASGGAPVLAVAPSPGSPLGTGAGAGGTASPGVVVVPAVGFRSQYLTVRYLPTRRRVTVEIPFLDFDSPDLFGYTLMRGDASRPIGPRRPDAWTRTAGADADAAADAAAKTMAAADANAASAAAGGGRTGGWGRKG